MLKFAQPFVRPLNRFRGFEVVDILLYIPVALRLQFVFCIPNATIGALWKTVAEHLSYLISLAKEEFLSSVPACDDVAISRAVALKAHRLFNLVQPPNEQPDVDVK